MRLSKSITVPDKEIELVAVRAGGPGGQNVNKVSSAVHLFFNIGNSSLPDTLKERLLNLPDQRITADGVIVIKAQTHRSQEKNKLEARDRLKALIRSAMIKRKKRKPTQPKASSRQKRLDTKKQHSINKALRRRMRP